MKRLSRFLSTFFFCETKDFPINYAYNYDKLNITKVKIIKIVIFAYYHTNIYLINIRSVSGQTTIRLIRLDL